MFRKQGALFLEGQKLFQLHYFDLFCRLPNQVGSL